jgi:hypothetical protein
MLGARDVALAALTDAGSPAALRTRSRQVLQQLHDAETVTALLDVLKSASNADVKREALLTLARLSNTEAPWNGDWWGTHPSTVGPYFAPVSWSETPRIRPVLRDALLAASGGALDTLTQAFIRNRVLPQGAGPLLAASGDRRAQIVAALVGTSQLEDAAVPLVVELDRRSPALHAAVAELLAGEPSFGAQTMPLARAAALDTTLSLEVRGRLVSAFAELPGDAGRDAAIALLAQLTPHPAASTTPAGAPGPVEAAWRRYVGDFERMGQLDYFITLANGNDPAQRTLADAVLVQIARTASRMAMLASMRQRVDPVIDAAWSDPAKRANLVDAIHVMRAESMYSDKLQANGQAAKSTP